MIHYPLTKLQCSPTSDGAGAAVIVSQKFLDSKPHLRSQAILMAGQQLMTDSPQLFSRSAMDLVGFDMCKRAAQAALREAKVSPKDVKVCELHDCFSANELITLEGLGFCEQGKAHEMVRNGDITYGGKGPIINPSGGLISKVSNNRPLPCNSTKHTDKTDLPGPSAGRHRLSSMRRTLLAAARMGEQSPCSELRRGFAA
jgi:sterol carrier protein 2